MAKVSEVKNGGWWIAFLWIFVLLCGMLSLYRTSGAAPAPAEPFANAVAQRSEMIAYLKEIRDLLKEQNALLKSGDLRVGLVQPTSKSAKP